MSITRSLAQLLSGLVLGWSLMLASAICQPVQAGFETVFQLTQDGAEPLAIPVQGADGAFYGTTSTGGRYSLGTLYRLMPSGEKTTLADFDGLTGAFPQSELVQGPDGSLYGTALGGGDSGWGTVFKYTADGQLIRLVSFDLSNGASPTAGLTFGPDGALYGITPLGCQSGIGGLFRLTTDGQMTLLLSFESDSFATLNAAPHYALTLANDGWLYGATGSGGSTGAGQLFKLNTAGQVVVLAELQAATGEHPNSPLTLGPDGNFYGSTGYSPNNENAGGTVYRLTPSGSVTAIAKFSIPAKLNPYGTIPAGRLAVGTDGNLYGVTTGSLLLTTGRVAELYRLTLGGQLTKIKAFWQQQGFLRPIPGVVAARDGALYGGFAGAGYIAKGSIYRMTLDGQYSELSRFGICQQGCTPRYVPTMGADGTLYGVTYNGGSYGAGTMYRIFAGAFQSVVDFNPLQVLFPSSLTLGPDGNLYGVSGQGGSKGYGTLFRVTPAGKVSLLYEFDGHTGAYPSTAPSFGPDGALYGYSAGGSCCGQIYKLSNPTSSRSNQRIFSALVELSASTGEGLAEPMTLAADGNFYGSMASSGQNNYGTIFRLTPAGVLTVLDSLPGAVGGYSVSSPLVLGPDGALYGTTQAGGTYGGGAIFRLGVDGSLNSLISFDGATTGSKPNGTIVVTAEGNLLGTTTAGGVGSGVIYQYNLYSGAFSVLDTYSDALNPSLNGLVKGSDGALYTTANGATGYSAMQAGVGTVLRWAP
jgi:uncharacterized repeat protein (TIGR03803 family)